MRMLALALLLGMPPGVHYQGTQGTGSVAWTPPQPSLTWVDGAHAPTAAFIEVTAASIPAGATVVAYAGAAEGGAATTLTVSSASLSWTQRAATNSTNTNSQIWTAVNGGSTLTSQAIRNTADGTNKVPIIAVWIVTNAGTSVTQTATNTGTGTSGTVTPTATSTAVYVGGFALYSNTTGSAGTGNTTDETGSDGGGYGWWAGHRTSTGTGALAVAAGSWTSTQWSGAAIAINGP